MIVHTSNASAEGTCPLTNVHTNLVLISSFKVSLGLVIDAFIELSHRFKKLLTMSYHYKEYAGLEIPVDLSSRRRFHDR